VLQVQQPRHKPRRQRRTTGRRDELRTELPIEHRPVDQPGEPRQLVPRIDDVHQFLSEQIVDSGLNGRPGSHRIAHSKLQGFEAITAESCNHRHPLSLRDPLYGPVLGLFMTD
jgi:hypothetical protein